MKKLGQEVCSSFMQLFNWKISNEKNQKSKKGLKIYIGKKIIRKKLLDKS